MFVCPVSNSWFLMSEMSSSWCLTCRIQIRSADSMNGFFIFLFFDSKYFFKGYSGFTQSWIIILQEFMSLIWNTLSNVRRLKIWVTEVVCNLSMNNSTTNKFKQSSRNPLWQRDMRYVSWPSIHCLRNLFTISLEKGLSWLSADCKCVFCSSSTSCTHAITVCLGLFRVFQLNFKMI